MAIRPVAAAKCCVVGRCDAVGAPAARMCHRRWQTMLNRWCSAAKHAGSGYLTIIRRRRCRTMLCHFEAHYYWCHLSAGCALVGLPAVMHGLPSPMAHPRGGHYYGTAERGIAKRDTMSCEACDAEPTEARHLARGERQRNPG